jgi:CBS domain-containing protein
MQVHQVMTSTVWAADAETTIAQAARLMARAGIAALPVLEGARLLGLVTDRDLARRGLALAPSSPVSAVMSRDVPACPASRGVADALRDMQVLKLHQLPVEDDDARLVGMVSLADAVAACPHPGVAA